MVTYKENISINLSDLLELYSSVGWSAYTENMVTLEKAVSQSLYVLSAWHDEQLVGLIRVVGDGCTIIYIQDILVRPDFQNQSIGTNLMKQVLESYKTVRQKTLLTEEAPNVRGFYEKFGFTSCDKGLAVAFYKEY